MASALPPELLRLVYDYIPYTVLRTVRRQTNEQRVALRRSPTASAHSIHLSIQRFHWRWLPCPTLSSRSVPLGCDQRTYYSRGTREEVFVEYTLAFHHKWTGPDIPHDSFRCGARRLPAGYHRGSQ